MFTEDELLEMYNVLRSVVKTNSLVPNSEKAKIEDLTIRLMEEYGKLQTTTSAEAR